MSDTKRFNEICKRYFVPFDLIVGMIKLNLTQKEQADLLEYMVFDGQLEKK